ncbi:unnamed protein product [Prunus brigantina]
MADFKGLRLVQGPPTNWSLLFLDGKGSSPLSSLDFSTSWYSNYLCDEKVLLSILAPLCCGLLPEHSLVYLVQPSGTRPGTSSPGTAMG